MIDTVGPLLDNVRYTMTFEVSDYVAGVQAPMTSMQAKGFKLDKFNNFWVNKKGHRRASTASGSTQPRGSTSSCSFTRRRRYYINKVDHDYYENARTQQSKPT